MRYHGLNIILIIYEPELESKKRKKIKKKKRENESSKLVGSIDIPYIILDIVK